MSGGEALLQLEEELKLANLNCNQEKAEKAQLAQQLAIEAERLKSLEESISNLTENHTERLVQEKRIAEERILQQKLRDDQHAAEIQSVRKLGQEESEKVKRELHRFKLENEDKIKDIQKSFESHRRQKETEIEALNSYVFKTFNLPHRYH